MTNPAPHPQTIDGLEYVFEVQYVPLTEDERAAWQQAMELLYEILNTAVYLHQHPHSDVQADA